MLQDVTMWPSTTHPHPLPIVETALGVKWGIRERCLVNLILTEKETSAKHSGTVASHVEVKHELVWVVCGSEFSSFCHFHVSLSIN